MTDRSKAKSASTTATKYPSSLAVGRLLQQPIRRLPKIPGARPSMLLDHTGRRRSEVALINGAVPVSAADVGLAAPMNAP
jgi:2-dehydropantoate 2-reductase